RAPAVGAARGCGKRRQTDVGAASPIAACRSERQEPGLTSVRGDPKAVDPAAAHDSDPPAAVCTGAEQRGSVVVDDQPVAPAQLLDPGAEGDALVGKVDAGDEDLSRRRERSLERGDAGARDGT